MKNIKNRIKNIKNKIFDNGRSFLQILLLMLLCALTFIFNLRQYFDKSFEHSYPDIKESYLYFIKDLGNIGISILILIIFILLIRKINKTKSTPFCGEYYHNYKYCWYWILAKLFNYKNLPLINVPLFIQYKLIINNVFDGYIYDFQNVKNVNYRIKVDKKNLNNQSKNYTLIIEDTYKILDSQIDEYYKNNIFKISYLNKNNFDRVYCEKYIDKINSIVRSFPEESNLHIFSTTNTKNTFLIIKNVFINKDRGNIKHLYVHQQESNGNRNFEKKAHKIF